MAGELLRMDEERALPFHIDNTATAVEDSTFQFNVRHACATSKLAVGSETVASH
jgi:hypothetical protein